MRKADREKTEAIEQLRQWIKPGDTVYTILDHVSSSGMSRAIRVLVPTIRPSERYAIRTHTPDTCPGKPCSDVCDHVEYSERGAAVDFIHPNYAVGKALGLRHWKRNGYEQDALIVGGCGMDMGFHLVYELSSVLYGGRLRKMTDDDVPPSLDHPWDSHPGLGYYYDGGYKCLGKGKCPSNYHSNHRDTVQCEGTMIYNPDGPNTGERCRWSPETGSWILDDGSTCPTCNGKGRLPNPDGPERFDLVHTDGYALRHKWL